MREDVNLIIYNIWIRNKNKKSFLLFLLWTSQFFRHKIYISQKSNKNTKLFPLLNSIQIHPIQNLKTRVSKLNSILTMIGVYNFETYQYQMVIDKTCGNEREK